MTQEEKQLLLNELCARLPYNICILCDYDKKFDSGLICYLSKIDLENKQLWAYGVFEPLDIENIKPYLRPMLSMTEEEVIEFISVNVRESIKYQLPNHKSLTFWECSGVMDWLNAHHFDYRRLIEKGLALEAPKGMYNTK